MKEFAAILAASLPLPGTPFPVLRSLDKNALVCQNTTALQLKAVSGIDCFKK